MAFFAIGTEFAGTAGNNGVLGSSYTGPELVRASVAHGVAGGTISKLQGGRFGHGFLSAGLSKLSSPAIHTSGANRFSQVAMATVVGGSVSSITGGKFANGAATAAMAYAFNQVASSGNDSATQDSAQYDDEGYLIGGYSPAAGTYMTDEGLLVDLQINDVGGMTDGTGGYYSYLGNGVVSRYQDPGIQSVAPEAVLLGGGVLPALRIGQVAITGFTRHGLNQVISRGGVGVSNRSILEAVRNPVRTRIMRNGTTQLRGANATVVINRQGQIVTAWPRSRVGHRIQGQ